MKILDWKSENFSCAMVEHPDGKLWTTTNGLTLALETTSQNIYKIHSRNLDLFDASVPRGNTKPRTNGTERSTKTCLAQEEVRQFLHEHMTYFGIKRMRQDMHITSARPQLRLERSWATCPRFSLAL